MSTCRQVAERLVGQGKGILAADESIGTMSTRLSDAGVDPTEENRRAYRELLATAPGLSEGVSGIIFCDETLGQQFSDGTPFPQAVALWASCPGSRSTPAPSRARAYPVKRSPRASTGCPGGWRTTLKAALGAERALGLDISNACAGMMTGVFILNDLIRQGRIRRGMVVSGEYISELGRNAAQEVRTVMDDQLASLTLGDAGAAAILERAPQGAAGIEVAGFTTLSEHSRLCVAFPATIGPGFTMHTNAREIHKVATEEAVPMLRELLDQAGLKFDEIDYLIPHQTSARAIKKAMEGFSGDFGSAPKRVVITVDELGNTASTTHFVALSKYLKEGRFAPEDRVLLLSLASGLEVGIVIFKVDQLVGRYGHDH